jgi:hypothetical protein
VALVGADVSEELGTSIIGVAGVGGLGTTLAVIRNRRMLRRNTKTANVVPSSSILVAPVMGALGSSKASVLAGAARRGIPEDSILQM